MRRLTRAAGTVILAVVGLSGCATTTATPGSPLAAPSPVPADPTVTITHGERHEEISVEQPPPFRIRYGDTELHLNPVTYCYRNGCADGYDADPPHVGSPEELFVFVPIFPELTAEQIRDDDYCEGRSVDPEVTPLGEGWWVVRPRGPAGDYRVMLFAYGSGDMAADIWWTTPFDRPLPEPVARLALIADHDGRPDSYGLELHVGNLPQSPTEYAATITVTAGNGESMTFEATQSPEMCMGEGSLYFNGPEDKAKQAAALGDFPFTTTVELTLDGVRYVATAVYPDDEIEGNEPSVALEFDPPLPR